MLGGDRTVFGVEYPQWTVVQRMSMASVVSCFIAHSHEKLHLQTSSLLIANLSHQAGPLKSSGE